MSCDIPDRMVFVVWYDR